MSATSPYFAVVPEGWLHILHEKGVGGSQLLVLLALAQDQTHADADGLGWHSRPYITAERIAEKTGMSSRKVLKALGGLVDKGVLVREEEKPRSGRAQHYLVTLPPYRKVDSGTPTGSPQVPLQG